MIACSLRDTPTNAKYNSNKSMLSRCDLLAVSNTLLILHVFVTHVTYVIGIDGACLMNSLHSNWGFMTLKLKMCCRGMSNSAAELDHSRNELVLVATRDIQCAAPPPQDQGHREHVHLWLYFHWLLGTIRHGLGAGNTSTPTFHFLYNLRNVGTRKQVSLGEGHACALVRVRASLG